MRTASLKMIRLNNPALLLLLLPLVVIVLALFALVMVGSIFSPRRRAKLGAMRDAATANDALENELLAQARARGAKPKPQTTTKGNVIEAEFTHVP